MKNINVVIRSELRIIAWRKPNGRYRVVMKRVDGQDANANACLARTERLFQRVPENLTKDLNSPPVLDDYFTQED